MAHASARRVGHFGVLNVIARVGKKIVIAGVIPMHMRGDHVVDLVGRNAERPQAFADRVDNLARALLCSRFVEARIADESAMRALDDPYIVGDRGHLVVRIAENIIFRALAGVGRVTDGVDFVDVITHDFFSAPTMTPARFSIILTMDVKSLSPPYSALVVSH